MPILYEEQSIARRESVVMMEGLRLIVFLWQRAPMVVLTLESLNTSLGTLGKLAALFLKDAALTFVPGVAASTRIGQLLSTVMVSV